MPFLNILFVGNAVKQVSVSPLLIISHLSERKDMVTLAL